MPNLKQVLRTGLKVITFSDPKCTFSSNTRMLQKRSWKMEIKGKFLFWGGNAEIHSFFPIICIFHDILKPCHVQHQCYYIEQ